MWGPVSYISQRSSDVAVYATGAVQRAPSRHQIIDIPVLARVPQLLCRRPMRTGNINCIHAGKVSTYSEHCQNDPFKFLSRMLGINVSYYLPSTIMTPLSNDSTVPALIRTLSRLATATFLTSVLESILNIYDVPLMVIHEIITIEYWLERAMTRRHIFWLLRWMTNGRRKESCMLALFGF